MEPCRRNPKGAGGLRRHTASELLPDVHDIAFVALPCLASARPLRAAAPPFPISFLVLLCHKLP
jgi:hypothetical protein